MGVLENRLMELEITHEVVRHSDGEAVHKGTGQQCADYLYKNKGNGIFVRSIMN